MRSLIITSSRVICPLLTAWMLVGAYSVPAAAQNGTWTSLAGGDYFTTTNWAGNTVAQGAGNTADFNSLDLNGDVSVTLNAPLTIGNMIFGDTNTGTGGVWGISTTSLATAILTLDNNGPKPVLTVNQLVPATTFDDAFIGNAVAGAAGFDKNGPGILTLGPGVTTNTITGGINVNAGTLRLQSALPVQPILIADGARLDTAATVRTITVPAGATATLKSTFTGQVGGVLPAGAGATLNLRGDTNRIDATNDWSGFQNFNIIGDTTGTPVGVRLMINNNPAFTGGSFTNSNLHLDNANLFVRTNSQGNDVPIGQLTGTTTGQLSGGGTGTAARYIVGGLNTDSTFEGIINGAGGLSLNKVGTGTLTLAGTFTNSPALNGQNPARTGGVFRVTTGTLKITGATSIPGGNGTAFSTIDVLAGATFDVSTAPGTFTTSALQKIQGSGTVLGNYNHADGFINPGDVGAPTAANEGNLSAGVTPTLGTINFNGNLDFNGGSIRYDMETTPGATFDIVHVTGTTTINSGKIIPNFIGTPTSSGTYTVVTSDGGFSGSPSNLTVDWPGRGTNPTVTQSGNSLVFNAQPFGAGGDLIWTGANSSDWDIETTQNWTNGGNPDQFFNLVDSVTFNETAANKTVTLAAIVTPTAVTINNTSPYMITGTGAITGPTGLTKTGGGMLTINLANNFTGPASVQGSTVDLGTFGSSLGNGPLTLDNVTILGINGGGLGNSNVTLVGSNTIQVDGTVGTNNAFNIPAITGAGNLTITSTVADKWFTMGGTTQTGTVNLTGVDGGTVNHVRMNANSSFAVLNVNDTRISQRSGTGNSTSIFNIGELHSDDNVGNRLNAFEGGSPAVHAVWQFGSLNTASDYTGSIANGGGSGGSTSVSHVKKVGTGTFALNLAAAAAGTPPSYTGNTIVTGGTLDLTNANLLLADTADVIMESDATFNLNFSGEDAIRSLFIDGIGQAAGTWGSLTSTATNKRAFFTGDGVLNVGTAATTSLLGDYTNDGLVDASDYVMWRDNNGAADTTLPNNNPFPGLIGNIHYDTWRENFGRTLGPGSGGAVGSALVPEPGTCLLAVMVLVVSGGWRRRK